MDKRVDVRRFIVPALLAAALCGTLGWSSVASAEETAAGGAKPSALVTKPVATDSKPAAPTSRPATLVTKPAVATARPVALPTRTSSSVVAPVRTGSSVLRTAQPAHFSPPPRTTVTRTSVGASFAPRSIPVRLPAPTPVPTYGLNGAPSLRR
ncbi:MAG TPA: hypothetical protein VIF09_02825 [Polyangiaceae bacterium]|jgi:hypothetical protein